MRETLGFTINETEFVVPKLKFSVFTDNSNAYRSDRGRMGILNNTLD